MVFTSGSITKWLLRIFRFVKHTIGFAFKFNVRLSLRLLLSFSLWFPFNHTHTHTKHCDMVIIEYRSSIWLLLIVISIPPIPTTYIFKFTYLSEKTMISRTLFYEMWNDTNKSHMVFIRWITQSHSPQMVLLCSGIWFDLNWLFFLLSLLSVVSKSVYDIQFTRQHNYHCVPFSCLQLQMLIKYICCCRWWWWCFVVVVVALVYHSGFLFSFKPFFYCSKICFISNFLSLSFSFVLFCVNLLCACEWVSECLVCVYSWECESVCVCLYLTRSIR